MLLFSLPLGALADRVQLRSGLLSGEVIRLASLVALILIVRLNSPTLLVLALLAMLGGTGTVAFQVAEPSLVARTTTGSARTHLNSSIELSRSIAVTAGPAVAGLVISVAGGSVAFGICVVLAATALLALCSLPRLDMGKSSETDLLRQFGEGLRFTLRNPWLSPILLVSFAFNLAWYMVLGVIVAWSTLEIGLDSFAIGTMFARYGAGMIVGATIMRWLTTLLSPQELVQIGPYCGFAFALSIAPTMIYPTPVPLFGAFFIVGAGPVIWTITTIGIRQAVTPHQLLGRVSATNMMLSAGARPIGAAIGYLVLQAGGYQAVFAIALLVFGSQAIAIGRTSLVRGPAPVALGEG